MQENKLTRVEFYSKEDMAGSHELSKGENILRNETQSFYTDINDILELYNIKKYLDNQLYLKDWTQEDIANFKEKANEYGVVIGQFISNINDKNFIELCERISHNYTTPFWELVNNQSAFKRISKANFSNILSKEPHLIHIILSFKNLVDYYDIEVKNFLITYSQSAEILLLTYEVQDPYRKNQKVIPRSLSIEEKENIILSYLDSGNANLNFISLALRLS